jgi:hypothetical protein
MCIFCGQKSQLLNLTCKRGLLSKLQRRPGVTAALLTIFWPSSDYLLIGFGNSLKNSDRSAQSASAFLYSMRPSLTSKISRSTSCICTRLFGLHPELCSSTQAGQNAARHLVGQGVLQSLIHEAYRAGLEARNMKQTGSPEPSFGRRSDRSNARVELDAEQCGAGQEAAKRLKEIDERLRDLEEQIAASCQRASRALRQLEQSLKNASSIELAAIER